MTTAVSEALTEIETAEQRLVQALADIERLLPERLQAAQRQIDDLREKLAASEGARAAAQQHVDDLAQQLAQAQSAGRRLEDDLNSAQNGQRELRAAAAAMAKRIDSAIGQVKLAVGA